MCNFAEMKKRTFYNRSREILDKAFKQREEIIRKGKSKNPMWTLDTLGVLKNFMRAKRKHLKSRLKLSGMACTPC